MLYFYGCIHYYTLPGTPNKPKGEGGEGGEGGGGVIASVCNVLYCTVTDEPSLASRLFGVEM